MKTKLDPKTLRWAARKAEKEAQITYDSRDATPAALEVRWRELDTVARELSSFGRYLATEARIIEAAAKKRKAKR
jgi:hypothetical protein